MSAYFVTGTDTGVGKTLISSGLLAHQRRLGRSVLAIKPAETGWNLETSDAALLADATGQPVDSVAIHRYQSPVAPAVAARLEGRPFSLARTVAAVRDAQRADFLLVEGAGGLLVPFDDKRLAADLVQALDLPLLIVARAGLGTINHTLLTLFEARRRGIPVAGVILNRVSADASPSETTNAAEIQRLGNVPICGVVAHIAPHDRRSPAALANAVAHLNFDYPRNA